MGGITFLLLLVRLNAPAIQFRVGVIILNLLLELHGGQSETAFGI